MPMYAPEIPTTQQLHALHPMKEQAVFEIATARNFTGDVLTGQQPGLIAAIGPCAMTAALETIEQEGQMIAELNQRYKNQGLYIANRMPPWKPRTDPNEWHGLETTDPYLAYQILIDQANQGRGTSIEIGHQPHMERYSHATVMSWFGGRNINNAAMMIRTALMDPTLPLAVKNGLDGDIGPALERVNLLNQIRQEAYDDKAAPVVLLYRGGENAQDPISWEQQYRQALEVTGGKMIVDVAHGTEMAHNPNPDKKFKKSVEGQIAALEHVISIAKEGHMPTGIMMEASNAKSPTDPLIPIKVALEGVTRLFQIRTDMPKPTDKI